VSEKPFKTERSRFAGVDPKGTPTFAWQLTSTSQNDVVKLRLPARQVLPIVFVPGIMGSNLCSTLGEPVWLLDGSDTPWSLVRMWARSDAGARQSVLHPDKTKVFDGGKIPDKPVGSVLNISEYTKRGWGQVGQTSYQDFLLWLEQTLNENVTIKSSTQEAAQSGDGQLTNSQVDQRDGDLLLQVGGGLKQSQASSESGLRPGGPISAQDLSRRAKFRFPVYAFGYNWLASNHIAGAKLAKRIDQIIAENNKGFFKCRQVIIVTHSMGGLVARSCTTVAGMNEKIAGIVHGVMPATGAPVAYRRCKIGMLDEDRKVSLVIGRTGRDVTAVFAQAPGALQLLPSTTYRKNWLQFKDDKNRITLSLPKADPYQEIYLVKDKWWGLVKEEWLRPNQSAAISWEDYVENIATAREFHASITSSYHPNTYVFFGDSAGGQASYENVTWKLKEGNMPEQKKEIPSSQTLSLPHEKVRELGGTPIYVGGRVEQVTMPAMTTSSRPAMVDYQRSIWEFNCEKQDGRGDGTVPASSGSHPLKYAMNSVRQQFGLQNIPHEGAYKDVIARRVTHYAITKIAGTVEL
jgi:hypothetical protein